MNKIKQFAEEFIDQNDYLDMNHQDKIDNIMSMWPNISYRTAVDIAVYVEEYSSNKRDKYRDFEEYMSGS